jgi:5'(3')-deoxyribonucleotidase
MRKLTIVCDLDSIIIDLMGPWFDWYNKTYNDTLSLDAIDQWDVEKFVKPECGLKIFDFFHLPDSYVSLPPHLGAVEGLMELHKKGHDIVICTAVSGEGASHKFSWCKKHLPFLDRKHIFVGSRKELLHADVFIDDGPHNIEAYRLKWPEAFIATIAWPYNKAVEHLVDIRAQSYKDTVNAWAEINKAIDQYAEED